VVFITFSIISLAMMMMVRQNQIIEQRRFAFVMVLEPFIGVFLISL